MFHDWKKPFKPFSEGSTWAAIGTLIAGASAVPAPFIYAVLITGVLGIIVKDKGDAS